MKIFILEDDWNRIHVFKELFFKHDLTVIETCRHEHKFQPPYDLILLDHDLGGRQLEDHEDSGTTFVRRNRERFNQAPVVIHSYNPEGAARMAYLLQELPTPPPILIAPFMGKTFARAVAHFLKEEDGTSTSTDPNSANTEED